MMRHRHRREAVQQEQQNENAPAVEPLVDEIARQLADVGCVVERLVCRHRSNVDAGWGETLMRARSMLVGSLEDPAAVSGPVRPPDATCDLVAVTGDPAELHAIRGTLLGDTDAPPPYLVAIARTQIFSFCRRDPSTIPAYLRRWYAGMTSDDDAQNSACVVCGSVAAYPNMGHPSCSRCSARTCLDCFPSLVCAEADDSARRVFECPGCRNQALACDLVHLPQPAEDAVPDDVWALVRAAVGSRGMTSTSTSTSSSTSSGTGLVVAKPASCTLVADVDARGRVDSPHWRLARRLVAQKGVVVGVGALPAHGRPAETPVREKFPVDPHGRAFLCLGGGRAVELPAGWRYLCCVYL